MELRKWTLTLIGAGVVSLPAVTMAEEKLESAVTALSATTISGFVDTSAQWNIGSGNMHTPTYIFGGAGKADGFNLNVAELILENPLQQSGSWAAGPPRRSPGSPCGVRQRTAP